MTALGGEADWQNARDPLDQDIGWAHNAGWSTILQVGHGACDNALIRSDGWVTDIVTIPDIGYSTVVRLQGGPEPGHPRRTGHQRWRHQVPPEVAVAWVLTNPKDDYMLSEWDKPD
jgi:hypothetical protein